MLHVSWIFTGPFWKVTCNRHFLIFKKVLWNSENVSANRKRGIIIQNKIVHSLTVLKGEAWWLNGEAWWLKGRRGGSRGGVVALGEAWWLNGSAPGCCPAVPGSNPASPQPTADCQSSGGLPPRNGTWLRADLCEGQQRKNYKNEPLVPQKITKKKKKKNSFKSLQKLKCFYS